MNYHSDEWIRERVNEHYDESLDTFSENEIVGCFYQGSGNYGLDCESSDVDTKLIIVPSFKDIALATKPVSTTHVRANDEHIDFKDIRLYMETFRKQNLNFLEILFTDYWFINGIYYDQWNRLIKERESIAHMNPYRAVKSMKGVAMEKYHAMERPYPSKINIIEKYGFDGKQVHHLIRVDDYLTRYIAGVPYEECLKPTDALVERMMKYKRHEIPLEVARVEALSVLEHTISIADEFCNTHKDEEDQRCRDLLEDVSYNIMKIAIQKEIGE